MADWVGWLATAGILVILDLFTGTFYLLMIAIGLAAGGLVALAGAGFATQAIVAGVVGVIATGVLHRSRFGRGDHANDAGKGAATRDRNVNLDIGERLTVPAWDKGRARVMYRGALWDVELGQGATAHAGEFRIVEVLGSRLVVADA
jgi:membrane protein implicated in regulation of membrane protease activity